MESVAGPETRCVICGRKIAEGEGRYRISDGDICVECYGKPEGGENGERNRKPMRGA